VETENKKGGPLTSYCLPVRFDLDVSEVSLGELREYAGMESVRQFFNLAVAGGNNPSVYVCVDGRKNLGQFTKTFFGKSATAEKGELLNELSKYPGLDATPLADVLRQIIALREAYMPLVLNEKGEIVLRKLTDNLRLKPTEQVVLVYAEVKAATLGLSEFTPVAQVVDGGIHAVPGYAEFIQARYKLEREKAANESRICYATGINHSDVVGHDIPRGYSFNSMFVKTTLHYAPLFKKTYYIRPIKSVVLISCCWNEALNCCWIAIKCVSPASTICCYPSYSAQTRHQ